MLSFVFMIGALNLLLGFGLAVAIEHAPRVWQRRRRLRREKAAAAQVAAKAAQVAGEESDVVPGPPPTPVVELPAAWLDALEQEAVVATSFVEASVQVLRLEVGRYRERLLEIDARLRALGEAEDADTLAAISAELSAVNQDWLTKQADAAGHLSQRRGNLGSFEEAGLELETTLMEQAAQIETTLSNLAALDTASDTATAHKKLVREICRLVDLAHALRDRMSDSLLSILIAEKKIATFEKKFQIDTLTALPNRFGFEVMLHDWWREDPARQRLVSCVVIDLDRVAKLNEKFGARRVDWIINGVARWLAEQLRSDRGYDRAVRLSGQSFALFLGDTGPRNATSAAERIRQTLEVTSFEVANEQLELTASFAVIEVDKKDTGPKLIKRLLQTLRHAKQAGRNKTSLDEGTGAKDVEPPQFQVKARVVRLQEE